MTTQQSEISRKSDRYALEVPARAKSYGAAKGKKVLLSDLSAVGCQLTPAHDFRTGGQVLVKIPGLDYLPATVVWKRQDKLGIEFLKPLHPRSVEEYARHFVD